jgi:hypothetical protein
MRVNNELILAFILPCPPLVDQSFILSSENSLFAANLLVLAFHVELLLEFQLLHWEKAALLVAMKRYDLLPCVCFC